MGGAGAAVQHAKRDHQQDDAARGTEIRHADAEEVQDIRPRQRHHCAEHPGIEHRHQRGAALGAHIHVVGQTQEHRQVHEGIHDREDRARELDQKSHVHALVLRLDRQGLASLPLGANPARGLAA